MQECSLLVHDIAREEERREEGCKKDGVFPVTAFASARKSTEELALFNQMIHILNRQAIVNIHEYFKFY